jgi:hypothetical protein
MLRIMWLRLRFSYWLLVIGYWLLVIGKDNFKNYSSKIYAKS